ncbi:MAG: T9SS type A sorting domain-containing protein [Bacteroidota bacterium]
MKKTLLFAALVIGGLSQLNAQCTISPGCSTGTDGYCTTPTASTSIPNGTASLPYNTVIQLSIGSSAFGGAAVISSATITSVTGLPTGLSYSLNPTNGVMPANSNACILIAGTPGAATAGTYTVTANVSISTTPFGVIPGTVYWSLTIDAATGIQAYAQASDFFISPNPTTSELVVSSTSHFGKIQIIDALGKVVISHDANYASKTTIDVQNLSKGVYFLQANDGSRLITRKFIKD